MREAINEEVSVVMSYSAQRRAALPYLILWRNQHYYVDKISYHHTVKDGNTLHHIFEFCDKDQQMWFRANFDTSNLHWKLEATHDGNAN